MKFRKSFIIAGLILLIAAGGAYAWLHYSKPVAGTGPVRRGEAMKIVPANVLITESFTMDIKSEQGGRILGSNVRLGQIVKAGEVLYQIDTRDLELDIERTRSEYDSFVKSVQLGSPKRFAIAAAEESVKNSTRLAEQGRISQQELERAKRALDELKYQLSAEEISNQQRIDAYENALKTKRRALEKMTVTVANDGAISEIYARAGDLVGGGQVLCRVISKERLVQAQISEEYFSGVRPGLPVSLQLLGYGGRQFHASVERVLPTPDEKNNRYIAYLKVDINEDLLVPKLTGEATIIVDKHDNALVVERRALLGNSVFVVRDGRAMLTPVVVGFTSLDQAEILDGLGEGDQIILDNPASFRNGESVRVRKAGVQ